MRSPSLYQKAKDAWTEVKTGMNYFDFPWELRKFFLGLIAMAAVMATLIKALEWEVRRGLASGRYKRPRTLNDKWNNQDQYDILWYAGIRKNRGEGAANLKFPTSSSRRAPMTEWERERDWKRRHHIPERGPKAKSDYSHTIYSNTRSRGLKKNKERHEKFVEERSKEVARVKAMKEENRRKNMEGVMARRRRTMSAFAVEEQEGKEMVGREVKEQEAQ